MNDRIQSILEKLPDISVLNAKIQEKWRAENTASIRARTVNNCARFRKSNPRQAALISEQSRLKRSAQKHESGSTEEAREKIRRIKASDAPCHYCQCPLMAKNIVVDHVIPLSLGGQHVASNLVGCCHHCNSAKGSKLNWKPKAMDMWREPIEIINWD